MLLGSPPDMVHGMTLRGTDSSTPLARGRRYRIAPGAGIHPCCSGLQVQGTAISPTSAALLRAAARKAKWYFTIFSRKVQAFRRKFQIISPQAKKLAGFKKKCRKYIDFFAINRYICSNHTTIFTLETLDKSVGRTQGSADPSGSPFVQCFFRLKNLCAKFKLGVPASCPGRPEQRNGGG